jgi:ubiquinone/menaquinone biosynthesis C-methylase UbiE
VPTIHEANIEVHTRMAERYNRDEPHFRLENQETVRRRLAAVRQRVPGGKLLDIGCGTGFIIHLAAKLFDEIHGVDITPAMMAQVRLDEGNIVLHQTPAEKLPFPDQTFDAASAYSFIDHIEDPAQVISEVARVLKPGGIFYVDLAPNRLFWDAVSGVLPSASAELSDIVSREVGMVTANDKKVERDFGISADVFRKAEPGKEKGGIDPEAMKAAMVGNGFSQCDVNFDWFLGQGAIMHGQSFADANLIEAYLRRAAPLTNHLFKYITFYGIK